MPWRYETLYAPFDFPIYKTEAELDKDKEKIVQEQTPIFNLNPEVKTNQLHKFATALDPYKNPATTQTIENLQRKLARLYDAGILQLPENLVAENLKTIKIVNNNIGRDVDFPKTYTLKKAYSTLTDWINSSNLPQSTKEHILSLNLNNYIQPNLEFDASKTKLQLLNQLKNISLTQGMVRNGEVIIAKRELVTPEKIKLLQSLKKEYRHNAGSPVSNLRTLGGQIILTLAAIVIFSIFFYYSKKRIFYNNKEFIFLYGSF